MNPHGSIYKITQTTMKITKGWHIHIFLEVMLQYNSNNETLYSGLSKCLPLIKLISRTGNKCILIKLQIMSQ
jgi:hypothetical protein